MSDTEKRLFKIRMRINQGRKANRTETELEYKRFADPKYKDKEKWQDSVERKKNWQKELGKT